MKKTKIPPNPTNAETVNAGYAPGSTGADFTYWASLPSITAYELGVLLTWEDPRADELNQDATLEFDLVDRAILAGRLHAIAETDADRQKRHPWLPAKYGQLLNLHTVIEWARLVAPQFAQSLSTELTNHPAPSPDPSHPHHSLHLRIANEAWVAVCKPGEPFIKRTAKAKIRDYLEKHHPGLSAEAKERICMITNPDIAKKGGAPRSSA